MNTTRTTCPCYVCNLTPQFYIVKLRFVWEGGGVNIFPYFLFQKIDCGYSDTIIFQQKQENYKNNYN